MYVHTKGCTTCSRLSENVVAAFTWNRNVGKSEAKHPIGQHFSQQFPQLYLQNIFSFVSQVCYGRPRAPCVGNGFHESALLTLLSPPSVRRVNLQCKTQKSSIESYTSVTRTKFHWHGPSDPHAYSTRARCHAIALTNSCPVDAPQCDE